MGDTRGPDLLHMALNYTWMILRLKQPKVGPGPWQSVTPAQECFLCGRAISQGLDCMHSGSLSPCKGGVTLGIEHHHHLVRSPPGAQRDEKVRVSFHSLVLGVQGTGMGGNKLDPKSLLPSALQRQPSYRLARAPPKALTQPGAPELGRADSACALHICKCLPLMPGLQDFKANKPGPEVPLQLCVPSGHRFFFQVLLTPAQSMSWALCRAHLSTFRH